MAQLLADSPPRTDDLESARPGDAPAGPSGPSEAAVQAAERSCPNCHAPLAPGQDWCLQCGAGAPGSLGASLGNRRATSAVLLATAVLVLGAAAAAYAALNHKTSSPRTLTTTVAQATQSPTTPPSSTAPLTPTKTTPPPTIKPGRPLAGVKPPKIPLTAVTPKPSTAPKIPAAAPEATPTPSGASKQPSSGATSPAQGTTPQAQGESQPALLLDTNAASTYNPYALPATGFGDPSLAIDGDPATGWTAQVIPASAPKMAEGLLIDLKNPQRLSEAVVATSTPGMTIQVYGAGGSAAPTSITAPAWTTLSASTVDKKKRLRIRLRHSSKAFRFVVLWISQAPATAVGTEQAPGHVSVNEFELLPAS